MLDEDNQDKYVTEYLVPANVTTRFELWEGFGWTELKRCVVALVIGSLIFFLTGLIVKTVQYDVNKMPMEQTIGLKNDANTVINGNIVIKKENMIPEVVRILFIIIPTALTYFAVKRDKSTGLSIISSLEHMKAFKQKQRLYFYKYGSGSEE